MANSPHRLLPPDRSGSDTNRRALLAVNDRVTTMSELANASVRVRDDLIEMEARSFAALAAPGDSLSGEERVALAEVARGLDANGRLEEFARHLYSNPATVAAEHVRKAANDVGDPQTVETIGIVARLSALDRLHTVLGVDPEPLPTPQPGPATGRITRGLKRRHGHVPMPPGPIPVTLDLIPSEAEAFQAMFGPLYMTEEQMGDPHFAREPGLNTPQLETIAARISMFNECFY